MPNPVITSLKSEEQFASLVEELVQNKEHRGDLIELLREDHSVYEGRGTNTVARMRGWVFLALARVGLPDDALIFILEELDTGVDPYLIAAASRALRSFTTPKTAFAPFVMRAITHIRYRDDPVSLERYGEYAVGSSGTSAVRELLRTLAWLGPTAKEVLPEIERLKKEPGGFSRKFKKDLEQATDAIQSSAAGNEQVDCCALPESIGQMFSWALGSRRSCASIESTLFQDQDAATLTYKQIFSERPSIVVFFYTRCDNPLKCSLTITKLAGIQKLLKERGLNEQIQTVGITYDPAFDLPERIHRYGEQRGVTFSERHRLLRTVDGLEAIRRHFKLGVNFVESLVNRHRIELYILDAQGRVAASFERLHWDEHQVVRCATQLLQEKSEAKTVTKQRDAVAPRPLASPLFGTLAAVGLALFPKCPLCWAGYMSFVGIAGLEGIPYSPWLQPLLAVMIAINLGSVWLRARATGRILGFLMVSAGAVMIVLSKTSGMQKAAFGGVLLTLVGSFVSTFAARGKGLNQERTRIIERERQRPRPTEGAHTAS